jgi:hypothetical protein
VKKKYLYAILVAIVALAIIIVVYLEDPNVVSACSLHGGKCYGFGDFVAENCEDHGLVTSPYECHSITLNTQCCAKE